MSDPHPVRAAADGDVDALATIWHEGWHDAHATILPPELTAVRTRERFVERLRDALPMLRVAGPAGAPLGFALLRDDQLNQLYVAAEARGTGVAAALVADAEARIRAAGFETAWLACGIGNDRAARFYEKCGWRRVGTVVEHVPVPDGTMALEVWRYEKRVR